MAKIVISNAILNITELKSRLRGVKTPGKRILAAAFKNNDYSALIGELLTRIELYQSLGVLDYKLKDVDTIQGMKFKFGFESVLASTLKASGVSSSPRVVQQIVRQQQVLSPDESGIYLINDTTTQPELNPLAVEYTRILNDLLRRGLISGDALDLFVGLSNLNKNILSVELDSALDHTATIEKNFNDSGMEDEDGAWTDIAEVRSDFGEFAEQFGIDASSADYIFEGIKDYTPSATTGYTIGQVSGAIGIATDTGDLDQYLGVAFDSSIFSGKINVANALTAYNNELNRINGLNVRNKQMVTEAKKLSATSISTTLAISVKEAIQFIDGVLLHIAQNPIDDNSVGYQDFSVKRKTPQNADAYGAIVEDWCSPNVFGLYKKIQTKIGDSPIQKAAALIKAKQGKPVGLVGDPVGDSVYNILELAKIKATYENRELLRPALLAIVANY